MIRTDPALHAQRIDVPPLREMAPRGQGRPLVIELAGPPGVGKSTLRRLLHNKLDAMGALTTTPRYRGRDNKQIRGSVCIPRLRELPWIAPQAAELGFIASRLLWTYWRRPATVRDDVGLYPTPMLYLWDEVKHLATLTTLAPIIGRELRRAGGVIVLDEGPTCQMASLLAFGHHSALSPRLEGWRDRMVRRWAALLDLVIWLDAPNELMRDRIRNRDQWHPGQHVPDEQVDRFLTRYRASYSQTIQYLEMAGSARVLRLRTDTMPSDQLASRVLELVTGVQDAAPAPVLDSVRPPAETIGA